MILQKLLFYFLLFSATLLGIRLTEGVRDDVFFPNERLKELMKIINKKIMILFYVSIYTFAIIGGAYYIISSVPCLMNKDFAIQRGKIQSVSLYEKNSIGTKYNIILVDENGKYNQVDHVFSDDLKEGDQLLLLQLWEKGVWIYCIIIMISLFNLVDNKILGVIGAIVFLIYTFSSFLSLMLEGKMYKIKHE